MATSAEPTNAIDTDRSEAGPLARAAAAPPAAIVFGGTIGLSAFLLFTAEPMVARLAQPVFGGAPAVWASVLVFFQVTLLLGYAYAHLVATRLAALPAASLHIGIALLAAVLTVLAPRSVAELVNPGIPTVANVLFVLAVVAGPASFVMTSTTPLVSSWYAREREARDPQGEQRDPYWLYALSNFGSLVSLLAYLFLIEPLVGLSAQRAGWTIGFVMLVGCLAVAAVRSTAAVRTLRPASLSAMRASATLRIEAIGASITPGRRGRWILLAAVPSGLLAAVTNLVTTDLLSAPLLWVVPLTIYLATFVVAFSERGRRALPSIVALTPAALTLLWIPLGLTGGWPIVPLLLIEYIGLAIVALALHGRLAEDRPPPAGLTGFYLTMSAGGAIGGAFVGILAPVAFRGIWEYPILIAAAAVLLAATAPARSSTGRRPLATFLDGWASRLVPFLLAAAAVILVMQLDGSPALQAATRWFVVGALILLVGGQPRLFAASTFVVLVIATFVLAPVAVLQDRSFFGVSQVLRDDSITILMHGTTPHGAQYRDPVRRTEPSNYYARPGPAGDLFAQLADRPPLQIRVAGLGAGSLATYARPGDNLVFYEIDPLVARIAEDPALFTYLSDAGETTSVRIGDGRLLIGEEPDQSADLVMLDAFTSDALPVHLITQESLADAARIVRPDGLLAVHVSNRYYDLEPPVSAGLRAAGLEVLRRVYIPAPEDAAQGAVLSHWLVAGHPTDARAMLDDLRARGWTDPRVGEPLTDDFADLLRYLRIR
jgi:hypothetical protein